MQLATAAFQNRLVNPESETTSARESFDAQDSRRAFPSAPSKNRTHDGQIRKILVPTDFSAGATRAVEHAVAVARQCGASLTLLHVIDVNALAGRDHTGPAAEFMKQAWAEGFDRMAELAWSLSGQVDAQASVHEGLPWEEIAARSRDFDLIILGQSERRSRWRSFSRHTAQRVLENAACPVMTVPTET